MFGRNAEKLEARALTYERKGKTAKALKNREKAAKIRASQGGYQPNSISQPYYATSVPATTTTYHTTTRTPALYETKASKWEQRGNYTKAQKNREKYWRTQNPQYYNTAAPQFYSGTTFLGYQVPAGYQVPTGTHAHGRHNPAKYEARAAAALSRGKQKKYEKNQAKALKLRGGAAPTVTRTPAIYEEHAAKWETRGNYRKAQKNREKAWRMNNPQHAGTAAPLFYSSNNQFLGYNTPLTSGLNPNAATTVISGNPGTTGELPIPAGTHARGRHNPGKYEARAAAYDSRGKTRKAQRNREKAVKAAAGNYPNGSNRSVAKYETNAQKWEQRGNYTKAQKNREKVWRTQNANGVTPQFYSNNAFTGYGPSYNTATTTTTTTL